MTILRNVMIPLIGVALIVFVINVYIAFHPSKAHTMHSPSGNNKIDFTAGGFTDVSYHCRAHDLRGNPFEPILLADLYWQGRHYPDKVFWSNDGSVVAVSIVFDGGGHALVGAYDFKDHLVIRSANIGFAPNDSKNEQILQLLEERGGYTHKPIPSHKSL